MQVRWNVWWHSEVKMRLTPSRAKPWQTEHVDSNGGTRSTTGTQRVVGDAVGWKTWEHSDVKEVCECPMTL
jgi:hypothetical protein